MAGDAFTLADISAFTIAVFLSDRIDWNAHTHLKRCFHLVKGRQGAPTVGAPNGCHPALLW